MATAVGISAINWAVRRTGRPSILVIMLAGMALGGAVLTGVTKGSLAVHDFRTHTDLGLRPFCA